jgi:hypothetical protein
MEETYST